MTPKKIQLMLHRGYVLLPLAGKRPLVRWKQYVLCKPSLDEMIANFVATEAHSDGVGLLTGKGSGIICADYDAPPYPTRGIYTNTPSGGRHYWHPFHPDDQHGTRVTPTADIPYIVRLYQVPFVNNWRIPIQPDRTTSRQRAQANPSDQWCPDSNPPEMHHIEPCAFIQYFHQHRDDPNWDGRYALARAYASNVKPLKHPDLFLGPNYQHTRDILRRISAPQYCSTIVRSGFNCPNFRDGHCTKSGAVTPYGLALVQQRQELAPPKEVAA